MQHFYLMPDQLIKLQQYHPLKQNKYFCIALIIQYACGKWCYWPTLFSYRKLLRSEGLGSVIVSLLFLVVRFLLTYSFFWGGITLAPHTSTIRKMVRTNIGMMSTFVVRPAYGSNPSTSQRLLFGQMVQFNRFVKSPYSPCSIVTIFNCTIVLSHCCRHEKHVLVPFVYFC